MNGQDLVNAADTIDVIIDAAVEADVAIAEITARMPFGNASPDITAVVLDRGAARILARHLHLSVAPSPAGSDLYFGSQFPSGRIAIITTRNWTDR